jgi:hypothetical protein
MFDEWRLFSAKNPMGSLKGSQRDKTAQASGLMFSSLFY